MENKTKVISVKSGLPYDVYIGRANRFYHLAASVWSNPFKPGRDGSIKECLDKYRAHVLSKPELVARLPELRGKVLACWCKNRGDEPCHGDVLVELAEAGEGVLSGEGVKTGNLRKQAG